MAITTPADRPKSVPNRCVIFFLFPTFRSYVAMFIRRYPITSQLIHYARAFSSKELFYSKGDALFQFTFFLHDFVMSGKSNLRKLYYGRYCNLIKTHMKLLSTDCSDSKWCIHLSTSLFLYFNHILEHECMQGHPPLIRHHTNW